MTAPQLVKGRAYYRITYAAANLTIPALQPMIYVGSNIFPDDDHSVVTHYCQDTISYFQVGAATSLATKQSASDVDIQVFPFHADEVGASLLTLQDAIKALQDALARSDDSAASL